jgi:hypothetical protein
MYEQKYIDSLIAAVLLEQFRPKSDSATQASVLGMLMIRVGHLNKTKLLWREKLS